MRKEVGEDDLNELRDSIVDELDRLARRATRDLKKGKIYLKKQKAFGKEKEHTLEASSLYQRFLDIGLIDRSFVKGPVMTESYGSSTEGKAKALLEKIESSGVLSELDESTLYLVAQQITRLLEKALSSVSSSPAKYKEWMQDYAFAIVKKGDPIRWQTPLGLDVEQVDFKSKSTKVSIDGGRKVVFQVYTDELDASAHAKGLSPNYIHSLDASHLMMTVNALAQRGVTDIVTIHDSFATHANDVDLLSLTLREAFIALHKKEILSEQYDFWHEVFGVEQIKISYVDKRGFNLEDVLKSEYFFA
jgi:DNA-directed RNA polymerase